MYVNPIFFMLVNKMFKLLCSCHSGYGNQQYVDYNIQCGEGKLAYFNITAINLEGRTCANPQRDNQLE